MFKEHDEQRRTSADEDASRGDDEYPKAFVAKKPGSSISGEEVQKFIEERLAKHKWLTAGVSFIDAIPRTASGKVIRRELPRADEPATVATNKL